MTNPTTKNIKLVNLNIRVSEEEAAAIDALALEKCTSGVTANRQTITRALIARGLRDAQRPR